MVELSLLQTSHNKDTGVNNMGQETKTVRIPVELEPQVLALRAEWLRQREIEAARKLLEEVGEVA